MSLVVIVAVGSTAGTASNLVLISLNVAVTVADPSLSLNTEPGAAGDLAAQNKRAFRLSLKAGELSASAIRLP